MKTPIKESILIVDDDRELIADPLVEFFVRRGWSAAAAYSGTEALDAFVRTRPNVVLLDIGLTGQSGLEVLPKMVRSAPDACILVLTSRSAVSTCTEAFHLGAWDFIEKPISPEKLIERVNQGLKQCERHFHSKRLEALMISFTRAVGHSLKNQLDTFRVLSAVLRDEQDSANRQKIWDKLDQHCEDYRAALDRFQRFARLESPDEQVFSLTDLLHRTAKEAAERFQRLRFGRRPSAVLQTEDVRMRGDVILMTEVLDTILTNAYEASPPNCDVTATLSVDGNVASITVQDQGEGFRPDVLDRIGRGWVSTRSDSGNYGIGLLMAARVARFYGGQLKASNRSDGPGARVEFSVNINSQQTTEL
jgi:signal transduction histidine kinase